MKLLPKPELELIPFSESESESDTETILEQISLEENSEGFERPNR
jgi:hypothetical protein